MQPINLQSLAIYYSTLDSTSTASHLHVTHTANHHLTHLTPHTSHLTHASHLHHTRPHPPKHRTIAPTRYWATAGTTCSPMLRTVSLKNGPSLAPPVLMAANNPAMREPVCMCMCISMRIGFLCICMGIYIYVCMHMYMYMDVCRYMYMYSYAHTPPGISRLLVNKNVHGINQ